MNLGEVMRRQRETVTELSILLAQPGVAADCLSRMTFDQSIPRQVFDRRRAYLGIMVSLGQDEVRSVPGANGHRALALINEIDDLEGTHFISRPPDQSAEGLQRAALYNRVTWRRSKAQTRVGMAVRLGLQPTTGSFDEASVLGSSSPVDNHVLVTFERLGVGGVSAAAVTIGLSRIATLFARAKRGIVDAEHLDEISDVHVPPPLIDALIRLLVSTPETVRSLWSTQAWRAAPMGTAVVPHGGSAAEFRPLLKMSEGRLLAPVPGAVAIAAEHLTDDLALGRPSVWPQFEPQDGATNLEETRHARGSALELAAAAAFRRSLNRGPINAPIVETSVWYATSPGDRWRSVGEVDVLVGCGQIQVALQCKANDYDGRSIAPRDFVLKSIKQVERWRASRSLASLRIARDNEGAAFPVERHARLQETARSVLALDVVLTLDDFGLLPTAGPVVFETRSSQVDASTAPIYMCLPDLWELCDVLQGRDLLTYLSLRTQLSRSRRPHELAEDGCLTMFLRSGQIYPFDQIVRALVMQAASHDPDSLYAWKAKVQHTESNEIPPPRFNRLAEFQAVLDSLVGPEAEIGHIVLATVFPMGVDEAEVPGKLAREQPSILRSGHNQLVLITDRLRPDLAGWGQALEYADAIRDSFRTAFVPRLIVAIHIDPDGSSVVVHGDREVLIEPMTDPTDFQDAVFNPTSVLRLVRLDLDRYHPCPCGSGKKFKWCVAQERHPVPLAAPANAVARGSRR